MESKEEEVELSEKTPPATDSTEDDVIVHEVKGSETLVSIAARYDTTPSLLAQHNRLSSRLIFPGQKLKIPPKNAATPPPATATAAAAGVKKPKPPGPATPYPEEPEMVDSQFIRVNVRHITDGKGTHCLLKHLDWSFEKILLCFT